MNLPYDVSRLSRWHRPLTGVYTTRQR